MKKYILTLLLAFVVITPVVSQERTASGYGKNESNELIALKTYKALMDAAVSAFQTSMTTVTTRIVNLEDDLSKYKICENLGKVYSPAANGSDSNGCINVIISGGNIPTCAAGKVLTSTNGTTLSCVDDQKGGTTTINRIKKCPPKTTVSGDKDDRNSYVRSSQSGC